MNVKGVLSSFLWQRNEDALKLIKSYIDKAENKEAAFNVALELPRSENVYEYFSYEEIFSLLEICEAKGWKQNLDYKEDDAIRSIKSYLDQAEDKEAALEVIGKLSHVDIKNNELKEDLDRNFKEVHYYDNNYVILNKLEHQLNRFINELYSGEIIKKLFLNKVLQDCYKIFHIEWQG
jgi:hypothetical protein